MSKATCLFLVALLVGGEALAKCGNQVLRIEGTIDGVSGDGLRIKVLVTPEPNWEPQPEIPIKDGRFAGMVLFDRTRSEGRVRDDYSRVPDSMEVLLLRNGQELSRLQLDFKRDFVRDKGGDYKLRSPIVLRSR